MSTTGTMMHRHSSRGENIEVGKGNKKQRQSERTRQRLVEAATKLFCELGYRDTSVQQIALHAEISQGSIFWHFGSKEGLLFEVVDSAFAEWEREALAPLLALPGAVTPQDLADVHLEFARRNPQIGGRLFFMLLSEALGPRSELRGAYARIYRRFRATARAWLEQLGAADRMHPDLDLDATAAIMVGMLAGIFLQWTLAEEDVDLDRMHADLARLLNHGLLVQ